jgi:hypothetical protein
MKGIVKGIIENDLGRTLTLEEEEILDEHTEIVTELYKLEKRKKELEKKIFEMKDISRKFPD